MVEETHITYQSASGREIEFSVRHERPVEFYVVRMDDEDKIVFGSYGTHKELAEMLNRMLSDLALLVEAMTNSINRSIERGSENSSVLYSCGYIKEK